MKVEENLTFKYRENKLDLMYFIYCKCNDYFKECNINNEKLVNLNNLFIKWMYSCFIDLHNKDCALSLNEKIRLIKKSTEKYGEIINNTYNMGTMIKVLKVSLRYPLLVWIISKFIFIIKVKFRQILYK